MKKIIVMAFLLCFGTSVMAQEMYNSSGRPANAKRKEKKKEGFNPDKLIYGGGVALTFGQITNLGISPMIGYALTPKWSAGISLGYQYTSIKDFWPQYDFSQTQNVIGYKPFRSSVYSGSIWTRYLVFDKFFAHLELEQNFMSFKEYDYDFNTDQNVSFKSTYSAPSLLVGAGFRQPISDRSSFIITALYDALNGQNEYSPYGDQIFSALVSLSAFKSS